MREDNEKALEAFFAKLPSKKEAMNFPCTEAQREVSPPGMPKHIINKIEGTYGTKDPAAYATMWKIRNQGWA